MEKSKKSACLVCERDSKQLEYVGIHYRWTDKFHMHYSDLKDRMPVRVCDECFYSKVDEEAKEKRIMSNAISNYYK